MVFGTTAVRLTALSRPLFSASTIPRVGRVRTRSPPCRASPADRFHPSPVQENWRPAGANPMEWDQVCASPLECDSTQCEIISANRSLPAALPYDSGVLLILPEDVAAVRDGAPILVMTWRIATTRRPFKRRVRPRPSSQVALERAAWPIPSRQWSSRATPTRVRGSR